MSTEHRLRFVHAQLAWMLSAALVMSVVGSLTYEAFFVLSFLGLVVVTEVTAPFAVTPVWRRRLRWIVLAGVVGFVALVGQRLYGILPPAVVPV